MIHPTPAIKCKKCGETFHPDLKTKSPWPCPGCSAKNPNLKRLYMSVADLCILSLIASVILISVRVIRSGLSTGAILSAGQATLLLVTIILVYRSPAPWADGKVKSLIWIVFGLAFLSNFILPLAIAGVFLLPLLIIYSLIFAYLFWLHLQAARCAVSGAISSAQDSTSIKDKV